MLLPLVLAALLGGDCLEDAAALRDEAEALLAQPLSGESLERARDLYRRAHLSEPDAASALRSADLAQAAGDDDEAARWLEEAARGAGELLAPWERLLLARQAEARRDRRAAILQYAAVLTAHALRHEPYPAWIRERIGRLGAEEEAGKLVVGGFRAPSPEARDVFQQARRGLERGATAEAREGFRRALRLSPGYVEAALALGSLEARAGRTPEALAAYRTALAADPERFEALLSLANLLWTEPDRQAKEESLVLLDRASALRLDLPRLQRESAERWAEWGDAARALDRLEAYRQRVTEPERRQTEALRERLRARVSGAPAPPETTLPDLASPALSPFRLAQVYARRGDDESLRSALGVLAEAESLDRTFSRAPELAASVHERLGDPRAAEEALRRALRADAARAGTHERLALLLMSQPGRQADAVLAWRDAEAAGSREALFYLAKAAEAGGHPLEARRLYKRYALEAPDGAHAEEVSAVLAAGARRDALAGAAAVSLAALGLLALGISLYLRKAGYTLEQWLAKDSGAVRELMPPIGRLRHEVFKHGGLLLGDAARRLQEADETVRRGTAELLLSRLFGGPQAEAERGLVLEADKAFRDVEALARRRGFALNLRRKDPLLAPVWRAAAGLRKRRRRLRRLAAGKGSARGNAREAKAMAAALTRTAALVGPELSARLGALLLEASSTEVSAARIAALLEDASREAGLAAPPPLARLGLLANGHAPRVRMTAADWETIWRNLFANALAAARQAGGRPLQLALWAGESRDPITGQRLVRMVLADDVPRPLTAEMIRGRAAERGLGIVADLVRTHEGVVDVGPPPEGASGCSKGIVVELPALEDS